uniref:Uncharacterized protein n=1 Tax=Rhizophora mucronata TaxID=61149 RepID=A0A2P2R1P3_RHIMU
MQFYRKQRILLKLLGKLKKMYRLSLLRLWTPPLMP